MPSFLNHVELVSEMVARYDNITHKIRDIDGNVLLKIDVESIRQAFGLSSLEEVIDRVDLNMFQQAFDDVELDV